MRVIICKDTNEVFNKYSDYLKSRHWAKFKAKYRSKAIYQCCLCESTEKLQLHHKTYQRVGNEKIGDCVYLCANHHLLVHKCRDKAWLDKHLQGKFKKGKKKRYWNSKRKKKSK